MRKLQANEIEQVAALLKEGNVVAFPTDTVFGLSVIYGDCNALKKLKQAKERDANKPIPIMVADLSQMEEIAEVNETCRQLVQHFKAGAITYVLKKKSCVADYVTNYKDTIAIRIPDDFFINQLLQKLQTPLFVTSANKSNQASGVYDFEVEAQLKDAIDAIVQGEAKGKQASTIVDVTTKNVKILREGPISLQEIQQVLEKEGEKI